VDSMGAAAFHQELARKVSYRPDHISVLIDPAGSPLPVSLTLVDGQNRRVGGTGAQGKVIKEIPFSDFLQFNDANGVAAGQLAIISAPDPGPFTIRLEKTAFDSSDATFTLSLIVPDGAGHLRQLV